MALFQACQKKPRTQCVHAESQLNVSQLLTFSFKLELLEEDACDTRVQWMNLAFEP